MKKKLYTRPVSVTLSDEMFSEIKTITDTQDISISDYIREAIGGKLEKNGSNIKNQEE